MTNQTIEKQLNQLGFHYLAHHHADFCAQAAKSKLSPYQMIERIISCEEKENLDRGVARRIQSSCIGRFRPLNEFDWSWPKQINREMVDDLMTLKFIDEPANAIIFGSSGVGKTTIAQNIAYEAAIRGHSTLFVHASDMLADLERQESPRLLKQRLTRYTRPKVLVIDEVGYLSYSTQAADLLFQVITRRHEVAATIITTNLAFKEWHTVLPGAACLVALIDRLTHRAEILAIEAESYRKKESMVRNQLKTKDVRGKNAK